MVTHNQFRTQKKRNIIKKQDTNYTLFIVTNIIIPKRTLANHANHSFSDSLKKPYSSEQTNNSDQHIHKYTSLTMYFNTMDVHQSAKSCTLIDITTKLPTANCALIYITKKNVTWWSRKKIVIAIFDYCYYESVKLKFLL